MPAPHDLDPDAMTENERLAKRRFEAGFAFETMPMPAEPCTNDFCTADHKQVGTVYVHFAGRLA